MSRYGITISPMMMNEGSTTPACHGSKNTSISCRPRKYHGALDGFGVRVGFAGSSSGASTTSDHTISKTVMKIATRNSRRTRCGQVCTRSSLGLATLRAPACGPLPAALTACSAGFVCTSAMRGLLLGSRPRRPVDQHQQKNENDREHEHAPSRDHHRDPQEDEGCNRVA